jgi:predicted nucleotidyltransferase component of viral defense system
MSRQSQVTRETWKQILASAVALLDDLERRQLGTPDVVIGGGTALMFRFEHRLSKDIDFFMHDVQWVTMLTPRLNDTTAALVTDYIEQANGIKLILPHGDIDFVVSGTVTDTAPTDTLDFMGRAFRLESTEEILAKKLYYRAARFQPRDVFDLVVAAELDRASAARAMAAAASKCDVLKRRFEQLAELPLDKQAEGILPIGDFCRIVPTMVESGRRLVQEAAP